MHPLSQDIAKTLDTIETEMISVGLLLEKTAPDEIDRQVSVMDRALRGCYEGAEATARLLTLLRDPVLEDYAPVELIRKISAQHPAAVTRKDVVEAMRLCRGDAEQVMESVRLVVDNAELGDDTGLHCEVCVSEGAPRIVFTLGEPINFPDVLCLGQSYTMSLEDFGHRWTAASGGGHVGQAPQSLMFFLEGERDTPISPAIFNRAAPHAKELARSLRSWRGAIGHYVPGYGSGAELIALYRGSLGRAHSHVLALREALGLR